MSKDIFDPKSDFLKSIKTPKDRSKEKFIKEWNERYTDPYEYGIITSNARKVFVYCDYVFESNIARSQTKRDKLKELLLETIPKIKSEDGKDNAFYPIKKFKIDNPIKLIISKDITKRRAGELGYGVIYEYLDLLQNTLKQMGKLQYTINAHKKENNIIRECNIIWGSEQSNILP
ncbi:hypothetical protein LCGC14_0222980 [marine sediment metagenome]|uniref:Uncharacterized protein n=1 Tax=marine sediment metagenome TaxID=412755 RepID=A0A0F9UC07_9ZZZZ|nr:hypothetical protein [bacterium]